MEGAKTLFFFNLEPGLGQNVYGRTLKVWDEDIML